MQNRYETTKPGSATLDITAKNATLRVYVDSAVRHPYVTVEGDRSVLDAIQGEELDHKISLTVPGPSNTEGVMTFRGDDVSSTMRGSGATVIQAAGNTIRVSFGGGQVQVESTGDVQVTSGTATPRTLITATLSADSVLKVRGAAVDITSTSASDERLDYLEVDIKSGDVGIARCGVASVRTGAGDIEIAEMGSGKLATSSGDIEVTSTKELAARTGSGDIKVSEASTVDLITGAGDIKVTKLGRGGQARSGSGNIQIVLTGDSLDTHTGSGNVRVLHTDPNATIRAHTGSGTKKIRLIQG